MKRILHEPLLHFLLIGALLFLIAGLRHGSAPIKLGSTAPQSQKIVITPGDVESLVAGFTNLWNRPPTAQELDGLIQGRIREEVYYRQALKMGLDRDDAIIRGRLQEKLEFLSQDVTQNAQPTEQYLQSFLAAHPEQFRSDDRFTFRLVFVDSGRHGSSTVQDAQEILAGLRKNPRLADYAGDTLPFPRTFTRVLESEIAKQFGADFSNALSSLTTGDWAGPLKTEDGAYLVNLQEHIAGQVPPLSQIRITVEKEWLAAQRRQANDKLYQTLLRDYTVSIEMPQGMRSSATPDAEPR